MLSKTWILIYKVLKELKVLSRFLAENLSYPLILMEIFLIISLSDEKIRLMATQAVLPTLLTHPKPSAKHKTDGSRIFLETGL
jgi:hypothetical protein